MAEKKKSEIPQEVLDGDPTNDWDTADFLEVPEKDRLDVDDDPEEEQADDAYADYVSTVPDGEDVHLSTEEDDDPDEPYEDESDDYDEDDDPDHPDLEA